jgi:hypothetical protein
MIDKSMKSQYFFDWPVLLGGTLGTAAYEGFTP